MHSILRDFLHKYLQTRTSGLVTETDVFSVFSIWEPS